MTLKEMAKMGLDDEIKNWDIRIRRVPGGWVYYRGSMEEMVAVFVPLPAGVEPVKDVDY